MPNHLETLLRPGALTAVFQPVVDVGSGTPRVFACEGLIRGPASSNFESPDVIFGYVRRKRSEERLDRACIETILQAAAALHADMFVSMNVHAATLGRVRDFADFLAAEAERNGIATSRMILEIVEHGSAWSEPHFLAGMARVRQLGLRVALDDVGAGLSNYKMILDTRPEFFKIDRYLVTGCPDDPDRRKVLSSIRDLAAAFGARSIAEGIETESEARTLIDLGFTLMQGFLFARPQSASALRRHAPPAPLESRPSVGPAA